MHILKGFATHSRFTDNTVLTVNEIGELSTYSTTFAKDKGFYTRSVSNPVTVVSFLNKQDGVEVTLAPNIRDHVLSVVEEVYQNTVVKAGVIYADELLATLLTKFQAEASTFRCGPIVNDGTFYIPSWVSWKPNFAESDIKIWFSDEAFKAEYDEFIIKVIPPIPNLNDFFKKASVVKELVEARDNATLMDSVQDAKNGFPETRIRSDLYDYVNPLDANIKIKTTWTVLIYGDAGNNIDSIKDSLMDYILSNSTYPREEWVKIFPDIFKRTEFIILPQWNKYAIEPRSVEAGIYSAFISNTDSLNALALAASAYPRAHINQYALSLTHQYKSLALSVVGSNENRDNLFALNQVFPDYINVSSTSLDFNRMSKDTRDFSELLLELIMVAEDMTEYSVIPRIMTKVKRNNKLYIVMSFKNIHYLVYAKSNPTV